MSEVLERIKARWVSDGLTIRPGASPEALDDFERRFGVALPPAVRDYFARVDGTTDDLGGPDWPWDRDANRFWPLSAILSIRDFHSIGEEGPAWTDQWFGFADHLINSHGWAVRLTSDTLDGGPVCFWDLGMMRSLVASSFDVFLEKYLAGSPLFGSGELISTLEDMAVVAKVREDDEV